MGKLDVLLQAGKIKDFVFGLTKSHFNVIQLIGKNQTLSSENISQVFKATIEYYNAGFAKETGEIYQPNEIIEEYLILIKLMFSEMYGKEYTPISDISNIKEEDALIDFSIFNYYVLLRNYEKVRIAIWKNLQAADLVISTMNQTVYNTAILILDKSESTRKYLPFDKWKSVIANIFWRIKKDYGQYDNGGEFSY